MMFSPEAGYMTHGSDAHYHVITDYGAIPDGRANCGGAIAEAIAACARAGGGTVVVPPGRFLTGPIRFVSHMTLYLAPGAELAFSPRFEDYPPAFTRWEGVECHGFHPLIYGFRLTHVSITGRGVIDGQGKPWWDERRRRLREHICAPATAMDAALADLNPGYESAGGGGGGRESQFLRPPLIQFMHCENVYLDGVTCRNSPFWNTHLVYCTNVHVRDVTFYNPEEAPNGDGLDIDSCTGVSVTGCTFDMGDDCIVIKSGCDADGRRVNRPCEDIAIANCLIRRGHGAVVFGSESAAGIRHVTVANCIIRGADRGVRFKSRRGRGGIIENIRISNITMEGVRCPLVINMCYVCGIPPDAREDHPAFADEAAPIDETTPGMRAIHLSGITSRHTLSAAAVMVGLAESPIEGVTLDNVLIELAREAAPLNPAMAYGISAMTHGGVIGRHIKDCALRNVTVLHCRNGAVRLRGAQGLDICSLQVRALDTADAIVLEDSRDVRVDGRAV
jgi:polygalacturonase